MLTRAVKLTEKYFNYAIEVIEGNPFEERQRAQNAQAAAENFYEMVSETPPQYTFGADAVNYTPGTYEW